MICAKNFARNYKKERYLEHQLLGQRVIYPREPAYYIVECQILGASSLLQYEYSLLN